MWGQHGLRESKTKKSPYVILKVIGKSPKEFQIIKNRSIVQKVWCF